MLARLARWSALLPRFAWCLGGTGPSLVPSSFGKLRQGDRPARPPRDLGWARELQVEQVAYVVELIGNDRQYVRLRH